MGAIRFGCGAAVVLVALAAAAAAGLAPAVDTAAGLAPAVDAVSRALSVDDIRKNIAGISASESKRPNEGEGLHRRVEHSPGQPSGHASGRPSGDGSAGRNAGVPPADSKGDPGLHIADNEPTNNDTNLTRGRSARSFWSSAEDTTEEPATETTDEQPEELPEPAALAIPVPSFLANLFSSRTPREPPQPPRARHGVDYRTSRRPDRQMGRHPISRSHQVRHDRPRQVRRRVYRQRHARPPLYQDHTEYEDPTPRPLPVRRKSYADYRGYQEELLPDYEHSSHSNHISINSKYDFITEAPYSPRQASKSKSRILDSAVFSIPPSSQADDNAHRSFVKRPERTGFGSAVNYDDNRFDILDQKSHAEGKAHDYVDDYDGDQNVYEDYHYDTSYKHDTDAQNRGRQNLNPKEDGRGGIEEFFSSVPSLNPLNFFRSSEQMIGQDHMAPATRSSRRRGHHLLDPTRRVQFGRQPLSHEAVTESPAFSDYIDFSELEPFYSSEKKRTDRRRHRFKAELPPGVGHLEPVSQGGARRRNSHNSMRSVRFRGSSLGHFPSISHEKIVFDQDGPAPGQRKKYEHHALDDFIVNIPSNEIQFEEVPAVEQDPRLEAFKYKEDYPLREDLYVGKDGNIYLQDPKAQSKTATATTDSDDFYGFHMYGMDQPLYQEVSVPRTRHISYVSSEDPPRRPDLTRTTQVVESSGKGAAEGSEDPMEGFEGTSPRRAMTNLDGRDDSRITRTEGGTSQPPKMPRFPASGGKTPYMSDFAKSLLKVKRARERSAGHPNERLPGFRRMKD